MMIHSNQGCQENNTMCNSGAKHLAERLLSAIENRAQNGPGNDTTGIPKLSRGYLAVTLESAMKHIPGFSDTVRNHIEHHQGNPIG